MKKTILFFLAALAAQPALAVPQPSLAEMRSAATRFRSVDVALAEGYVRDPSGACHTAEMMGRPAGQGAMGIHYFRPDLLGIAGPPNPRVDGTGTHTDWNRPAVLLYEPQADGSMQLVGVENLVFQAAWRAAGHSGPPRLHGRAWDTMADDPTTPLDEAHGFAPHFDQHVWLFRANPRGTYEPFNPNVTCAHHRGSATAHGGHGGHGGHAANRER
jgi:hypothetical protein